MLVTNLLHILYCIIYCLVLHCVYCIWLFVHRKSLPSFSRMPVMSFHCFHSFLVDYFNFLYSLGMLSHVCFPYILSPNIMSLDFISLFSESI